MLVRVMQMSLLCMMVLSSFFILLGRPQSTSAAASSTINFQARLLTAAGNVVPDGQYNVEFKLYNAASSTGSSQGSCSGDAACKWTETRTTSDKVRVVNGYLTVNLGSVTAFGSTINWDQEHWLTMNIGGTGSITWDGEMTPRLKLTAVPHALSAGQLANTNGVNRSTLGWATQTTSNSILLPNEAGTLCIQSSTNCGFLTSATGDANYIKLQGSTPGTPQTGNLNISGTGVFGTALQAPIFDRASAGVLQIGTTNATSIGLQQNTTLASGKTLTLQGGFLMTPSSDSQNIFNIRTSGNNNMFTVDTQNSQIGIALGASNLPSLTSSGVQIRGAIRLSGASGTYADTYITTKVGTPSSIPALINIVNYDPGATGQFIAMGIPVGSDSGGRAISLFDARASAHYPTLAIFSPDESVVGGFSWDGSNSTFLTKTTSNNMALQAGSLNILTLQNVSSAARLGIGNGSPGYALDVNGDANLSTGFAYKINGTNICTASGCTPAAGSGNYIQNTTTVQTNANFALQSAGDSSITMLAKARASQTADLLQLQDSGSNVLASFTSAGNLTFGNTADKTITITQASSGNHGNVLTIQAGSGNGTNRNGGNLILQGGNNTGSGAPGGVIVRPQTNSTTAFQVQNAAGSSTVLDVDTTNGRVGIGNTAPTVDLDIGPGTLGTNQIVQVRVGDFLLQSQQGVNGANGLAALTTRGSNGNLTLDGASGSSLGLLLSPFTTNNNFLAAGGGKVRVGDTNVPSYKVDVAGDVNVSTGSAYKINGTNICTSSGCTPAAGSANYIQNTTSLQSSANMAIQSAADASITILARARASQSVDLIQLQDSSSNALASFTNAGNLTFGNTADKTISIAQASSGNNGNNMTLQAGSGNGTNKNGGNLILQGGNSTGSGTPGSVIVKPQTNTTTAFQVQNTAGTTTVLDVDTSNARVGIGTNAPTRALDVSVSDSSNTSLPLIVRQASTGDAGIEIRNSSSNQSFYVGMDTSDSGRFKITSNTPSGTPNMGTTTQGSLTDSGDSNFMNSMKVTAGATGTVTTLYANVGTTVGSSPNNQAQMAIFSNLAGEPGTLLASSSSTTIASGWNAFTLTSPLSVTSGTIYWIAYNTNGTASNQNDLRYESTGGVVRYAAQTFGTWPSSFGGATSSAFNFSMYAVIQASSGTDTFSNNLFQMTSGGETTFKNVADSAAAFQIQNAAGVNMFNVDATTQRVYIGPTAGDTVGTLLVLGNKTNSGDPTGVAGAMYYNSNTGNFRCYNSGAWQNCVGGLLSSNTAVSSAVNTCTTACASFSTNAAIPANYCQPGRVIRIMASGVYSTNAAVNLSFGVYYGTDASNRASANNVQIGSTSFAAGPSGAITNAGWSVDFTIVCFSTTSMNGQGQATLSVSTSATTAAVALMASSASTTVVSNSNKNLYLYPTWSANAAANTATVHQFVVQGL